MLCKKDARKICQNSQENTCYQSLFFNKVVGSRPAILLKKRLRHRYFPVNFVKFLRTPVFAEHLCWLLLYYAWKKVWIQLMTNNKEITIINWGDLYYTFWASGKSYKVAQNFRVLADGKTNSNLKLLKDKIRLVNNFLLFNFVLFLINIKLFLNT